MPTPISSNSPALSVLVTKYGVNHPYVERIVSIVNGSPYLNQLFNEFEARTLPDGSKPFILNSGVTDQEVLPDTNATDQRILLSDEYFKAYDGSTDQRAWELNFTKDLAHEIQHSNTYVARRAAEAAAISQSGTATELAQRLADMRTNDELTSKIAEFNALQNKGGVTSNEMRDHLKGFDAHGAAIDFHAILTQAAQDPNNLDASGLLRDTAAVRGAIFAPFNSQSGSGSPLSTYGTDHLADGINKLAFNNRLSSGETFLTSEPIQQLINAGLDTRGHALVLNANGSAWVRGEPQGIRVVDPATGVETWITAKTEAGVTSFAYITTAGGTVVSVRGSVNRGNNTVTIDDAHALDEGTMTERDITAVVRAGIRGDGNTATAGPLEDTVGLINAARTELGLGQSPYQPRSAAQTLPTIPAGNADGQPLAPRAPLPSHMETGADGDITVFKEGKPSLVLSWDEFGNEVLVAADTNGDGIADRARVNTSGKTIDADVAYSESDGLSVSGITAINGLDLPPDTYAIDPQDFEAYGFTWQNVSTGTLPDTATRLIDGLDPSAITANGWPNPQVVEFALPQGFTRTLELGNGTTLVSTYNDDRRLVSLAETTAPNSFQSTTQTYAINADGSRTLQTVASRSSGMDGSYVGSETDILTRQVFKLSGDPDGNTIRALDVDATANLRNSDTATVFSDINALIGAIKGDQPIPILASGIRLLNNISIANGQTLPQLGAANTVAAGALSFYNLYNAFNSGNDFAKVNASLSSLNYANEFLKGTAAYSPGLSNFLNGSGGGLLGGGSVGVLPALGLIASIKAGDPIGMAMSIGTLANPAFLTTPLGWALIGASILQSLFSDDSPPDAWGVANVTFGPGITNYGSVVNATGENFGPERVRAQLQNSVDALSSIINQANSGNPDSRQHLGLIPQRMPSLNYRAAEFADMGYSVTDIDPLSGAQRAPFLRFDDQGRLFGATPDQLSPEERAMMYLNGASNVPPLTAYMLNSALDRQAIAPMWEVKTARLQQEAGDPNAGLTEEERVENCYENNSFSRNVYWGWRSISYSETLKQPANEAFWEVAA